MINFFRKYWLFIVLALVATLLGLLWLNKKPQVPEVPQISEKTEGFELVGEPISPNTTVTLNVADPYKSTAPLLKVERQTVLPTENATQAAALLGFTSAPEIIPGTAPNEIWLWSGLEHNLTITPKTNEVNYARDWINYPSPLLGTFKETTAILRDFTSLFAVLGLKLDNLKYVERFVDKEGNTVSQEDKPAFKEVRLKYFTGENQVLEYTGQEYITLVLFDSVGRIVKLYSVNQIKDTSPFNSLKLKSFEELAADIKEKGRIREISSGHGLLNPKDFTTIELTTLEIAYFLPQTGEFAHPVFLLSGTVADTEGGVRPISLLLQAAKSEEYN